MVIMKTPWQLQILYSRINLKKLHAGHHPHGQHDHLSPTAMSAASMQAILSHDAVQEMVYYQTIDDDDEDLLAAILAASDAAPKYNPELLKGASDQQVL